MFGGPDDRRRLPPLQPLRQVEAELLVGGARPPEEQRRAHAAEDDVRQPDREPRREQMSFGQRRAERERNVVREDHAEAEHEAAKLSVAAIGGAERQPDHAEYQACDRDRKLPLNCHDLVVR